MKNAQFSQISEVLDNVYDALERYEELLEVQEKGFNNLKAELEYVVCEMDRLESVLDTLAKEEE